MSNLIMAIPVNELTVNIYADVNASSPREYSNLGILCLFHRRYELPQEQEGLSTDDYPGWAEMEEALLEDYDARVLRPVYGYDHSGLFISTQREPTWWHYDWDGGQLGFIFTTDERIKDVGCANLQEADELLIGEVLDFANWVAGRACRYEIVDKDGEIVAEEDGFLDTGECENEACQVARELSKERA